MLQSIIEVFIFVLLVIGFINEEKVAKWERKLFAKIKKAVRK